MKWVPKFKTPAKEKINIHENHNIYRWNPQNKCRNPRIAKDFLINIVNIEDLIRNLIKT